MSSDLVDVYKKIFLKKQFLAKSDVFCARHKTENVTLVLGTNFLDTFMNKILTVATAMVAIATTAPQAMEANPKAQAEDTLTTRKQFDMLCATTNAFNPASIGLMQKQFMLIQRKHRVSLSLEQIGMTNSSNDIAKLLNEYAHTLNHPMNTSMTDKVAQGLLCAILRQEKKVELVDNIKVLSLHFDNGEKEGFDSEKYTIYVNFNKYKADGTMKEPVCGYDRETGQIVPKYITVQHTVFRGFMTANDYLIRHLFQGDVAKPLDIIYDKSDIHKSLWKSNDSFATPGDNLLAISGAIAPSDEVEYLQFSEQLFDYYEHRRKSPEQKFIPRVFSITYNEYKKICDANPKVDLLMNITKTICPSVKDEEAQKKENSEALKILKSFFLIKDKV